MTVSNATCTKKKWEEEGEIKKVKILESFSYSAAFLAPGS